MLFYTLTTGEVMQSHLLPQEEPNYRAVRGKFACWRVVYLVKSSGLSLVAQSTIWGPLSRPKPNAETKTSKFYVLW